MRKFLPAAAAALLSAMTAANPAQAVTIDTSAATVGGAMNARSQVAQSFAVDPATPILSSLSVWFHTAAAGRTAELRLTDALTGGTTFFSQSFTASAGRIDFTVDALLTAGTVYAILDFGSYKGRTLDFVGDVYIAGAIYDLNNGGKWNMRADRDLRMSAEFLPAVKLPSSLPLLLVGVCGLGLAARRRKTDDG